MTSIYVSNASAKKKFLKSTSKKIFENVLLQQLQPQQLWKYGSLSYKRCDKKKVEVLTISKVAHHYTKCKESATQSF